MSTEGAKMADEKGTGGVTAAAALIAAVASIICAVLSGRSTLDKQYLDRYEKMFDRSICQEAEEGPLCASRVFRERSNALNSIRSKVLNAGIVCANEMPVEGCVASFVDQHRTDQADLENRKRWMESAGKKLNCEYPANPADCGRPKTRALRPGDR
jgi:hypothetical protein